MQKGTARRTEKHLQRTGEDSELVFFFLFFFYHKRVLGEKRLGWGQLGWCREHLKLSHSSNQETRAVQTLPAQVLCEWAPGSPSPLLPRAFHSHAWPHGQRGPLHLGSRAWTRLCLFLIGHRCGGPQASRAAENWPGSAGLRLGTLAAGCLSDKYNSLNRAARIWGRFTPTYTQQKFHEAILHLAMRNVLCWYLFLF